MKKMATINSLNSFLRDTEEVKSKSWVKRSSLDSDNYLPHLQVVAYRKSLPYLISRVFDSVGGVGDVNKCPRSVGAALAFCRISRMLTSRHQQEV